jgi:hypothetical protein
MIIGPLLDLAVDRLQKLATAMFGPFFDGMASQSGQLLTDAESTMRQSIRNVPDPKDCVPELWTANAIRLGLEDLADGLALHYRPGRPGTDREVSNRLIAQRAYLRAYRGMRKLERNAGMLFEFLEPNVSACKDLLGEKDDNLVKMAIGSALDRCEQAERFEQELFREAQKIIGDFGRPYWGKISLRVIGTVRDALRARLANTIPFSPQDNPTSQLYYFLAFGDLFRCPRESYCQAVLHTKSDKGVTPTVKNMLRLKDVAQQEIDWLISSGKVRRTLRWSDGFVRGQESIGDDWYALVNDAGMTPEEVAVCVGEDVEVITAMVERYDQALWQRIKIDQSNSE